ncbi:Uncharacterised protein [uncultured archaeon]|nr:Uncharacterised protein [uncultured archaeon]
MLEFRDFSRYFQSPPRLEDMLGGEKDARHARRAPLAIIVPAYKDHPRLKTLFSALKTQAFQDFDLLIIYGAEDEFLPEPKLSILHVKRRAENDLAFCGAVYLGQLLALRDQYEYLLITDIDKLPVSADALGALMERAQSSGADITYGRWMRAGDLTSGPDGGALPRPASAAQKKLTVWPSLWAPIRTAHVRRIGLYLAPLYMGFDDPEYGCRLATQARISVLPRAVFSTGDLAVKRATTFTLLQSGGADRTYFYSTLLGMLNFPEAFVFSYTRTGRLLKPVQFLLYALVTFPQIFLLKARLPDFEDYYQRASRAQYGLPSFKGLEQQVQVREANPDEAAAAARAPRLEFPPSTLRFYAGHLRWLASSLLAPRTRPAVPMHHLDYFTASLFDDYFVQDAEGKIYCVHWLRPLGRGQKLAALLSAYLAMAVCTVNGLVRGLLNSHHAMCAYGKEAIAALPPSKRAGPKNE